MRTLLSSPCQLRLEVVLRHYSLSFLQLANYYRQFVKYFAKLAKPLHRLVRKDEKWNWEEEQKTAL